MKLLEDRAESIERQRAQGRKVGGYFCPYVPIEIVHASNMIPLRLACGGDDSASEVGERFLGPYSCPFAKTCIGYRTSGESQYHSKVDYLCVATTCDGMRSIQEYWQHYFKVPTFALWVPRTYDRFQQRAHARMYFEKELVLLKERLEREQGTVITDQQLRESIRLYNSIRSEMRELYSLCRDGGYDVSWGDVFRISQTGFLLDPVDFLAELKRIRERLGKKQDVNSTAERSDTKRRLMFYGSIMSMDDRKTIDIVEKAGGEIVADAVCTGSRFWRKDVSLSDPPIAALAERYLLNLPCPFMMDLGMRLEYVAKVARENKVNGLIYYNLKYCESYRAEVKTFENALRKTVGIPVLLIETEYSPSDVGTIRTKVEAFLEMISGAWM